MYLAIHSGNIQEVELPCVYVYTHDYIHTDIHTHRYTCTHDDIHTEIMYPCIHIHTNVPGNTFGQHPGGSATIDLTNPVEHSQSSVLHVVW